MTVLELTSGPHTVMLVIIFANMTADQVFGARSLFGSKMTKLGLWFRQNSLSMTLGRLFGASIKYTSSKQIAARFLPEQKPCWLAFNGEEVLTPILRTEVLANYLSFFRIRETD